MSIVAAALLALGTGACGTDEQAVEAAAKAKRAHADAVKDSKEASAEAREAVRVHQECSERTSDLMDEATELDSRLGVGLNYDDYSEKAADLNVAYDQVDFATSDVAMLECLRNVGLQLEKAVNRFIKAYETWNECFEAIDCDNDSITSSLQLDWAKASVHIEKAKKGLSDLEEAATQASDEAEDAKEAERRLAATAERAAAAAE